MFTPSTTMSGARSPPMASRAMVSRRAKPDPPRPARSARGLGWRHLAAIVIAACAADMMGTLDLAAIRALDRRRALQRFVRPTHVATRLTHLLLWNCHNFSLPAVHPYDGAKGKQ